jgi:hypothetical protein
LGGKVKFDIPAILEYNHSGKEMLHHFLNECTPWTRRGEKRAAVEAVNRGPISPE